MSDPLGPLRDRFRIRALDEADAMEAALARHDWPTIEQLVHGLAGSAGVFGQAEIGAAAAMLDAGFAQEDRPAPEAIGDLVRLIRARLTYS